MPPKVLNVDIRSIDRDIERYPDAANFSIDLGREFPNVTNLKLGSLEVPNTRYSVENSENCVYMDEGFAIGNDTMNHDYNRITVDGHDFVIPATLMPISSFVAGTEITTKCAHGLKRYVEWSLQSKDRPKALFVGAEPSSTAKKTLRAGIYLHQINVQYPQADKLIIPSNIIKSFGLGSSSNGYIYVAPLHLYEILSLLNYQSDNGLRWIFKDGRITFGKPAKISFPPSPPDNLISLGEILGLSNGTIQDYAPQIPSIPKVRLPPGFYANPPSLIANAVEEAIMNRGLITVKGSFKIGQLDALFSETITINEGLYTPELLQDTMQQSISSNTSIILDHVDNEGVPREGWIRWSFRSDEGFPFEIDLSGSTSAPVARILGFRQRRYSGQVSYVGEAYSVPASRNIMPAPPPSRTSGSSRGDVRRSIEDLYRYNIGVYTITGTSPSQQRFSLFTEPSQSFAVPNTGANRNFYESVHNAGIIDITTSGMASPQSYGFRRGDVVRLTGVSEETVGILPIVNTATRSTQIASSNIQVGVVGAVSELGGSGYDANMPPEITVRTPSRSGHHPTFTPHIVDGNLIACSLQDHDSGPSEYDTPPDFVVSSPPSWTVESASIELIHSPERNRITLVVSGPTIIGVAAGRAAVVSNMGGATNQDLFRVRSVQPQGDRFEVVVENEALDSPPLPTNFTGGTLRFGLSNAVDISTVSSDKTVTLTGPLPSATASHTVMLAQVAYANVIGTVTTISVVGNTATVTHDNLLTAPIAQGSRIILRNTNAYDGVWIVTAIGDGGQLQANQFTFTVDISAGVPGDFNGNAVLGSMNCSTCASLAQVVVGTPAQRPTISFEAVSVPYADFTGVGGMCAFAPEHKDASLSGILVDDALDTVRPSISGFLQTAFSTANLNSEGAPVVTFSGGTVISDVFNPNTNATAASSVSGGDLVTPDEVAFVQVGGGMRSNIVVGRFTDASIVFTVDASDALSVGTTYQITNAGNGQTTWENAGASSRDVGTVFTATSPTTGNGAGLATRIRNYSGSGAGAKPNIEVGMVVTQVGTNATGTILVGENSANAKLLTIQPVSGSFNATSPITITNSSGATVDTIAAGDIAAVNSTLRLTMNKPIPPTTTEAQIIVSNFYFDGVYDSKTNDTTGNDWESVLDSDVLIPGQREIVLRIKTLAPIRLSMNGSLYPVNPTTLEYVYPSMYHMQFNGQYTNAAGVVATIGVSNDVSTRTGIVTYARYEDNAFRYLVEYNNRGLNNGRGFEDATSQGSTIVLTFSRISEPRSEYFGRSCSILAQHDMEMRSIVSPFTEQIVLRRLGIIQDVFAQSTYLASSQWYLEGQPYRLLQFFDEQGNKLGETSHTHAMSRNHETDVFGKLIIPAAYNTVRFQPLELAFTRPRTLRVIRIQLLGYDEQPYPLHGRELTFSLLLTCNMDYQ